MSGCPVEAYARAVLAGGELAGELVRLACERHLRDLAEGGERGLVWDGAAAARPATPTKATAPVGSRSGQGAE
jgi:hypothetical protein